MAYQVQPGGAEGSLSESVHYPLMSSVLEHPGAYQVDGRMAMAPPSSSASRAPPLRPTSLHEDGRPHYLDDRPEYRISLPRHSCGVDHTVLPSETLMQQLLFQENQKALRMASILQSQASGCVSGFLSCGLSDKRPRFPEAEDGHRCSSRDAGDRASRSTNLVAQSDATECPEGRFRHLHPRQSIGERSQSRISFSKDGLGRSLCQAKQISYRVYYATILHSQANHQTQDRRPHSVGGAESSVPISGFSNVDDRVRPRRLTKRQSYLENVSEEVDWQRPSRSRVVPASAREQDRLSLPGLATGLLLRNSVGSPHRAAGDSVRPLQSTRTSSQTLFAMSENSIEPFYQDNAMQQTCIQRLVTQGPVALTNWYIIKVQIPGYGRGMETKVALGGWHVQNREHVRTAPIANRLDIHNVVTEDGVEVFLGGAMDQETSSANGFSPGIVQCLFAGFPYMWKQLLRVKSVGEVPPSLAVSERLGDLHSKGSKCLLEDVNQDVDDLKFFKNIGEAASSWSRGCGDAMNADSLVTPVEYVPDAVGAEAAVIAGGQTSDVAGMEAMLPIRAETSEAVDECHPRDVLVQQSCDVNSTTLGCALVTETPFEHAIETSSTKKAETDPIVKTNSLTTRSCRKSKKELSLPVRSSRRLQKRQSRSSGLPTCRIDLLASDQIEEVAFGISIADEKPSEVEPGEVLPDKVQAITECNKLSNSDKVNDLQQDQDPVKSLDDLQPKEVVVSDQTEDHHECLLKDSDGLVSRTLLGEVVIEDVLAGAKIEATVPVATRNLENEDIEKSIPVADFVLEREVAVGALDSEREDIDESAPATPPELLQSKIQSRVEFLSKASSLRTSEQRVLSEIGTRVTRSLKRRLRISPTTDTEVLPLIRSMRRSGRISKANTVCVSNSHQDDVADLEVMLDPDPPPQEEVDFFHVRVRGPTGSSAKAVKCSNCNQPCSPPVARKRNCNFVRPEVSYEQAVPKEERMDYAPLSPFQQTEEVHELRNYDRTDTYLTELPSGQFKTMEPATRFAETGTFRRMTVGVASEGPSKGKILSKGKGSNEGPSHSKRLSNGNGSDQGKGSNRGEEVYMQGKGSCGKDDSRELQGRSESIVYSQVNGISEGLGLVLSRVKNRRKSIIPPPLPLPRVRDKSRVPEAFGLKTSRSGRLLVPPLAYWRSQSIEYDKDGGIIAIFDGFQAKPADTGCFNFTPPQEKHVKRIQEKLCKAATSITKRK